MDRNRTLEPSARLCVLTSETRGAVAVVRVWGTKAVEIADAVFRPARGVGLSLTPAGKPRLGQVGAGLGDEVVALIVVGEQAEVEIHCHGGPAPVALVVEALTTAGAERRQPSAWVRHDSRTTIEAEARVDLARAPTLRTAEILLEQAQGALERDLAEIVQVIKSDRAGAIAALDRLHAHAKIGLRLISGWSVALAGRPNVGKSRLLNALAGYDRAIVDPTPGTTRDVVTARTAFNGWPVELADTAGLRDADSAVESAGIAMAIARHSDAELTILVLDRSEPLTEIDRGLIGGAGAWLIVANKSDLSAAWESWDDDVIVVSAERGEGVGRLVDAIANRLVPESPGLGDGVPFRPSHLRRIDEARDALRRGDDGQAAAVLREMLG